MKLVLQKLERVISKRTERRKYVIRNQYFKLSKNFKINEIKKLFFEMTDELMNLQSDQSKTKSGELGDIIYQYLKKEIIQILRKVKKIL